jgi:hypothetical protein
MVRYGRMAAALQECARLRRRKVAATQAAAAAAVLLHPLSYPDQRLAAAAAAAGQPPPHAQRQEQPVSLVHRCCHKIRSAARRLATSGLAAVRAILPPAGKVPRATDRRRRQQQRRWRRQDEVESRRRRHFQGLRATSGPLRRAQAMRARRVGGRRGRRCRPLRYRPSRAWRQRHPPSLLRRAHAAMRAAARGVRTACGALWASARSEVAGAFSHSECSMNARRSAVRVFTHHHSLALASLNL